MEDNYAGKWNIKGVDRVTPLHKALPLFDPKTPDRYIRPLMKISGFFCAHKNDKIS